ncbi:MAG: nucleotidyltransferase [Eubacteriales bacterium]
MKILGIVAEYNPFHNGHKYHLIKSKEITGCDYSVAVMSGNFLQRGEPALYDKWIRSEIAIQNGIDLVIEIPAAFACNNAEYFAKGSIGILEKIGCISHISFGSESGNIEELREVAQVLATQPPEFLLELKRNMKLGYSYPKSRMNAIQSTVGTKGLNVAKGPNNNLAVEYLRQLLEIQSKIEAVTIQRSGAAYDDKKFSGEMASATAIRETLAKSNFQIEAIKNVIPKETYDTIEKSTNPGSVTFEEFYEMIVYKIMSLDLVEIGNVFSVTEGLENRIKESFAHGKDIEELIAYIKSKRFTKTRIQRILIHTLLGLTRDKMEQFMKEEALYARVLGANKKGQEILKFIKKQECASIPIITNINKEAKHLNNIKGLLDFDIMASNIFNLGAGVDLYSNSDYVKRIYLENSNK